MPRTFEQLTPQNFSFNSPLGWCEACEGLGVERGTNQQVLVANPNLSLLDGAVSAWPKPRENATFRAFLEALAAEFAIPLDVPWYQLDSQAQRVILYGSETSRQLSVVTLSVAEQQAGKKATDTRDNGPRTCHFHLQGPLPLHRRGVPRFV